MGNPGQLALLSVRGDQEFSWEEDLKIFHFSSPSHLTFSINRTGAQEVSGATWEPCSVRGTCSFIYFRWRLCGGGGQQSALPSWRGATLSGNPALACPHFSWFQYYWITQYRVGQLQQAGIGGSLVSWSESLVPHFPSKSKYCLLYLSLLGWELPAGRRGAVWKRLVPESTNSMCHWHESRNCGMSFEEQGYSLKQSGQNERNVSNSWDA